MPRWEPVRFPRFRIFFLPSFCFFQQLLFTGDIAAVALGQHVLTHGLHRFTGDDAPADGRLNGHLKQLAGDILLQLSHSRRARDRPYPGGR